MRSFNLRHGLPPGPRFAVWEVPKYLHHADAYYQACLNRYGDPFTEPTLFGPQVVTAEPLLVREIFAAPAETFDSFLPAAAPLLGRSSLLIANGERHRSHRRLLQPPFHRAHVSAMAQTVFEAAKRQVEGLEPGRPYRVLTLAQDLTLKVVLQVLLHAAPDSAVQDLRRAVPHLMQTATPVNVLTLSGPGFIVAVRRLGFGARLKKALYRVEGMLQTEVERRRARGDTGEDVLGLLLKARNEDGAPLTDGELRDHMLTLILGGHETTATTLAWGVWQLERHPDAVEALRGAYGETDGDPMAVAGHPYVKALVHEVLRLHPVGARIGRKLRRPMTLGAYRLPPGVAVAAHIGGVHRNELLYPEPERFRPARFLERSYKPYEFFPFGGGYRRCLGAELARMELALILTAWYTGGAFRLRSTEAPAVERRAVTLGPKGGIPATYERMEVNV